MMQVMGDRIQELGISGYGKKNRYPAAGAGSRTDFDRKWNGRILYPGYRPLSYARGEAEMANYQDSDYFLSIHRNAMPVPGTASGIQTLIYDNGGAAQLMASEINKKLTEMGWKDLGVMERPGLIVLRKTKCRQCWWKLGFLDHEQDNRFFDQNFQKVAQAIADGILEAVKLEADGPAYYQIQVGAYKNRQEAERLAEQLKEEEYPAFLVAEDGWFKVRVGAYLNLDHAAWMEKTLRAAGYPTFMVKEREK